MQLLVAAVVLWTISYYALTALGSWGPAADAWILTGSILATYGMARGYVEFWLIWIAVDLVGVPLLLTAGYYPSAIMYIVYGVFCVIGFISWWRIERAGRTPRSGGRRLPADRDRRLTWARAAGRPPGSSLADLRAVASGRLPLLLVDLATLTAAVRATVVGVLRAEVDHRPGAHLDPRPGTELGRSQDP